MSLRVFKATDSVVEHVRGVLDQAWGYPNAETLTESCLPLASQLPHDKAGLAYLVVADEFCTYDPASQMLPMLLSSGQVTELTHAEYRRLFERPSPARVRG